MSTTRGERLIRRDSTMNKLECKIKLKHQIEIGHRLEQVGLYTAATESRNKALVLLRSYRRHFREKSTNLH
jgi:hypothetical protein